MVARYNDKVHGQSGLRVPRFPGSGIWVPCRHGWIFMPAQVWHGMSLACWCWGILLKSWHGGNSWSLVHLGCQCLQVQWVWAACTVQVEAVVQVCATEKWCLVRACSVAVVPFGTVLTALTLHSQRCLCMQQYVEPLLLHT